MPNPLASLLGRKKQEPDIPVCPDHDTEMHMRGSLGRPSRFSDQTGSEYTLIYFCPVDGCNETETRTHMRSQIPVPGAAPSRPIFSRVRDPR